MFPDTSSPELSSASAADIKLADIVSQYWVNFARTGDPNGPSTSLGASLPRWPQFKNKATGRAMLLGVTQQPQPDVPRAKFELYDKIYAQQMASSK